MGTVRKTITLTDLQDQWIKARIAAGHYTNDSEYIRDLIRRDHERGTGIEALKAAVREGLDSGPTDKTVPTIMQEVEAGQRKPPTKERPVGIDRGMKVPDSFFEPV
ncbi:MAG: type II toxin-antitoxin system ParD family antitoxin [Acidobacteria bacterium]|nr:type II toxin-antitoxin system ParD family antitoxin [Acidobacteriota bacterium]